MSETLRYSREELLASHAYARPHVDSGRLFHGGFDADGVYVSPRTLKRRPAVEAWSQALAARGWPLIDPFARLKNDEGYPSTRQYELLLRAGLDRPLWDQLSIIGLLERRAGKLCGFVAPDMQAVIVEDIGETALGHLNQGLLPAHGMDESGDPAAPALGAHDAQWFAVRDMVLGENAYPVPTPPDSMYRPAGPREMPALPAEHERTLGYLMNILMVEARAESLFTVCGGLFRNPELFQDRRDAAERAAALVERICADESLHLLYLSTVISEFRSLTVKGVDGSRVSGADIIDPVWARILAWHSVDERRASQEAIRGDIERQVTAAQGAAGFALLAAIDALDAVAPA